MDEKQKYRLSAVFRDGHTFELPVSALRELGSENSGLHALFDYMNGTGECPKKHYLLWFKLEDDDNEFTVSFDPDGDAYIDTPGGGCVMTEFKIRSAALLLYGHTDIAGNTSLMFGFSGINTCGKQDGKLIHLFDDGSWKSQDCL